MIRGVGRTFKRGIMSEAIYDHIVHVVDILTETHNSGHDTGEGEFTTITLSVSPISDIGNLITPAMSIDEICCSVSRLSNGDRSADSCGAGSEEESPSNNDMKSIHLYNLN